MHLEQVELESGIGRSGLDRPGTSLQVSGGLERSQIRGSRQGYRWHIDGLGRVPRGTATFAVFLGKGVELSRMELEYHRRTCCQVARKIENIEISIKETLRDDRGLEESVIEA